MIFSAKARILSLAVPAVLCSAMLSGCVAPVGPVQVTRFHDPSVTDKIGRGTIAVEAAEGMDPTSLELRSYQGAVARQLTMLGYREATGASSAQVALVRLNEKPIALQETAAPLASVSGAARAGMVRA